MILIGGLKILSITTEVSVEAKRILGDKRKFVRAWAIVEFNDKSIRLCSDTVFTVAARQILDIMGFEGGLEDMHQEDRIVLCMWLQELQEDMVEAIRSTDPPSEETLRKLRNQRYEHMRQKRIQDVRNAQKNELSNIFTRFDFSMEEVTELWKMAQVTKTMEN